MRFIPHAVHGILDYLVGLLLLVSPWLFGYAHDQPVPTDMAMIFGGGLMLYTALTNFEVGIVRLLPFPVHMVLDVLLGAALVASPILFSTGGTAAVVFVLFGIFELLMTALTRGAASPGHPQFPSWT